MSRTCTSSKDAPRPQGVAAQGPVLRGDGILLRRSEGCVLGDEAARAIAIVLGLGAIVGINEQVNQAPVYRRTTLIIGYFNSIPPVTNMRGEILRPIR